MDPNEIIAAKVYDYLARMKIPWAQEFKEQMGIRESLIGPISIEDIIAFYLNTISAPPTATIQHVTKSIVVDDVSDDDSSSDETNNGEVGEDAESLSSSEAEEEEKVFPDESDDEGTASASETETEKSIEQGEHEPEL